MAIFGKKKNTDKDVSKKDEAKKSEIKDVKEEKKDVKKDATSSQETKEVKKTGKPGFAYKHLVKPLITEKAANLGINNQYVFIVSVKSNKVEIKKAINEVYGVKATNVNIINNEGKIVRRGRYTGKRKDFKKAIVTIEKGKSLNIYEGV
ncbi:MAG TPA: 50S ribosomal protein L23 [Patescibacteria group bacterium]|nr:50S ribosomal protein L23 [Patescibacteria group bacterium]